MILSNNAASMSTSETRRILILTADAGFGHRSAANALAAALNIMYADSVTVDIVNPLDDKRTPAFLRDTQSDHDKMVREMSNLYQIGYEVSDAAFPSVMVESVLILMMFEVMNDLLRKYEPDVVVTTYPLYQAPLDAVRTILRKKVPIITVITDLATVHRLWFNDNVDECLTPTTIVRDLAIKNGLAADKVHITGIPVNPVIAQEQRDKKTIRTNLQWLTDKPLLLVVGSRRVRSLRENLRVLNHCGLNFQLAVISGGDQELYQHLQETEWHIPTYLYNFVENMAEMMLAADCILTKAGGLIVTEALACGLPLVLVDVNPGQEVGNADFVVSNHAGVLAKTPMDTLETIFHWLDNGGVLMKTFAEQAYALGKPQAAFDVAKRAWELANQSPVPKTSSAVALSLKRLKLIEWLRTNGIVDLFSKEEVN